MESVHELSSRPACVLTAAPAIGSRVDAWFYRRIFVEVAERILTVGDASTIGKLAEVYRDPFCYGFQYLQSGVPYIRAEEANLGLVDPSVSVRVGDDALRSFPKAVLRPYDVIMTVRGANVGVTGLLPSDPTFVGLASPNIIRIRASGKVRPTYLWAFLSSHHGRLQTNRYISQTAQPTILGSDIKSFLIPLPDRRIQDYIGAKVELAERCRSKAQALRDNAVQFLAKSWGWSDKVANSMQGDAAGTIAHTVEPRVFDERLDPEFYRPRFLVVEEWLNSHECWRLSELVEAPIKGVQPSYALAGTVPALTVTHVDPFVLDQSGATGFVTDEWLAKNGRARIEAGELLYTVTGPPLGETVVVEEFHLPAAVNSHVARVRLRPKFKLPYLLAGMLNSPLGQLQTTRYCKGIRQKELYPSDFIRFRFPKLPSAVGSRLDKDFGASCRLAELARVLVQEAKAEVEAMIEGTLDVQAILAGKLKAPTTDDIPELTEDDA